MSAQRSLKEFTVYIVGDGGSARLAESRLHAVAWHHTEIIPARDTAEDRSLCLKSVETALERGIRRGTYPFFITESDIRPGAWMRDLAFPVSLAPDGMRLDLHPFGWSGEAVEAPVTWRECSAEWVQLENMMGFGITGFCNAASGEAFLKGLQGSAPLSAVALDWYRQFRIIALREPLFHVPCANLDLSETAGFSLPPQGDVRLGSGEDSHGYWLTDGEGNHVFDESLAAALAGFLKQAEAGKVVDLGCGPGRYTRALNAAGISCQGFDGNPHTPALSEGTCGVADLTRHGIFPPRAYDWVLSLEVSEHIPVTWEAVFLHNLTETAATGVILSWAVPGQTGTGHVNCRSNEYVQHRMRRKDFHYDAAASDALRSSVSDCAPWFRNTLMVFRRTPPGG